LSIFSIFRHETRLRDLEDRSAEQEREIKQLELEWSSVYDNVRRLFAKIAKRDQRATEPHEDGAGATNAQGELVDEDLMNRRIRESRRGMR
jgi:uncharacterized coiled-coil protein SlyX